MIVFYFDLNPLPVFSLIAVSVACLVYFAKVASENFQRYKISDEQRLGIVNEWLQNIKSLKLLGWVAAFESKLLKRTKKATDERIRVVTWAATMNTFAEMVPMLLNIVGITTLLMTREVEPTPGEVLGILWVLAVFLAVPMRALPWVFVLSMDAKTSLARIEEYLQYEEEESAPNGGGSELEKGVAHLSKLKTTAAIEVTGLAVQLDKKMVLEDIAFEINSQEFVAIVGDVGAGKSTLLHALMGELPFLAEKYRIHGRDHQELSPAVLRSFFSYSPQEAFIFGASLRENVEFDFTATQAEVLNRVKKSLDLTSYGPDLENFGEGVETQLGERGVNLSGGQKQRLALARAHFADREIILLDDTLSALDADTEDQVVERLLLQEWSGYTRILVTHRLSVLPHVDRILYLHDGQIMGDGSWEQLQNNAMFVEFVKTLATEGQSSGSS